MGSTTHLHWVLISVVCALCYLIFDALRSFALQLSPVRLRTYFETEDFQLVSGALLQFAMVIGIGATTVIFDDLTLGSAVLRSVLIWAALALLWKFFLAVVPDDLGEVVLRALIPFARGSYYLFWPFLFPLRKLLERVDLAQARADEEEEITDEEVQAYIDVGEAEGIIEAAEGKMLASIVEFGDRLAHEIMTPRIDVLAFDARLPIDELAKLFSESKYARIPIYEQSIDQISGIIHIKDLFDSILKNEQRSIADLARPPYFVSETKKVSELLREFQSEHLQIAVVVDEYGGTAGIITTEDIVEEIVGEIADEHEDEEATIVEVGDGTWLVSGLLRVETLEEKLDADLSGDDYETVAGLIFTTLGRVPATGTVVRKNGFLFEIERADRRRIYRVKVQRDPEWRKEEEEEEE
ncbi:MAG TPA: hemolysin family protein [Thermoanaerobaculia bacterium]|nr:hemolysin family protein [Thermoanaerobaculia bacterium]